MYEMWTLGFLIGLQHALEADHLMAMATLASGGGTLGAVARRGIVWGIGHTATLLALGGTALLLGELVPQRLATLLEFGVGAMLVLLGADVLRRLWSQRVHVHPHTHAANRLAPGLHTFTCTPTRTATAPPTLMTRTCTRIRGHSRCARSAWE